MLEELLRPTKVSAHTVKHILKELATLGGDEREAFLSSAVSQIFDDEPRHNIEKESLLCTHILPYATDHFTQAMKDSLGNSKAIKRALWVLRFSEKYARFSDEQKSEIVNICNRIIDEGLLSSDDSKMHVARENITIILEHYDSSLNTVKKIRKLASIESWGDLQRFMYRRAYLLEEKIREASSRKLEAAVEIDDFEPFEIPSTLKEIEANTQINWNNEHGVENYWHRYEDDAVEEISQRIARARDTKKHVNLFLDAALAQNTSVHLFARAVLAELYAQGTEAKHIEDRLLRELSTEIASDSRKEQLERRANVLSMLYHVEKEKYQGLFKQIVHIADYEVSYRAAHLLTRKSRLEIIKEENFPYKDDVLYSLLSFSELLSDDEEDLCVNILHDMLEEGHANSLPRVAQCLIDCGTRASVPKLIRALDLLKDPGNMEFVVVKNRKGRYVKRPESVTKPMYYNYEPLFIESARQYLCQAVAAIMAREPADVAAKFISKRPIEELNSMIDYFTPRLKAELFFNYYDEKQQDRLLVDMVSRYRSSGGGLMGMAPAKVLRGAKELEFEQVARDFAEMFRGVADQTKVVSVMNRWHPIMIALVLNNYDLGERECILTGVKSNLVPDVRKYLECGDIARHIPVSNMTFDALATGNGQIFMFNMKLV